MDYIQKFKDFINNIKVSDNIAIFYHSMCTDGLCSCIITSKAITKITNVIPKLYIQNEHEITKENIKLLKDNYINKIIFVDLCPDKSFKDLRLLEKDHDILIIDHHKYLNNFNSDKTLFVHSEFIREDLDGSKYPASKLCYDLFSKMINVVEFDWLAAVGLVSDMGYKSWAYFVIDVQNKYHLNKDDDPYRTEIGNASSVIKISKEVYEDRDIAFDVVFNSKNIFDVLNNKLLIETKKKAEEDISKWMNNLDKIEKYGELIVYEIKPKYKIHSTLSTQINLRFFPDNTVIVISDYENKEFLEISARDQRCIIKLNEFLRDLVKDLPDSTAGGHIPAAGARIRKEDLNIFKKRLIEKYPNK